MISTAATWEPIPTRPEALVPAQLREAVFASLGEVAPEMERASLDPSTPITDQREIDSIDFLDFIVGLAEQTGVEVPERDYGDLVSVDDCVRYLIARVQGAPRLTDANR